MFLYIQDNVLRCSGKCCATVRRFFLCGEDFVDEAEGHHFLEMNASISLDLPQRRTPVITFISGVPITFLSLSK